MPRSEATCAFLCFYAKGRFDPRRKGIETEGFVVIGGGCIGFDSLAQGLNNDFVIAMSLGRINDFKDSSIKMPRTELDLTVSVKSY